MERTLSENLELEYETIENESVASVVSSSYSTSRSLIKSMRAIVCLFSKTTSPTDSEEYLFPNIESVKVTIEGVPNAVYS